MGSAEDVRLELSRLSTEAGQPFEGGHALSRRAPVGTVNGERVADALVALGEAGLATIVPQATQTAVQNVTVPIRRRRRVPFRASALDTFTLSNAPTGLSITTALASRTIALVDHHTFRGGRFAVSRAGIACTQSMCQQRSRHDDGVRAIDRNR